MIKKIIKKMDEKREKKNWGKGTIICKSMEEFDKYYDEFKGQMVSPGSAASRLGVSRAYINQLEKEGRIRAYRIWQEDITWDDLPLKWKPFFSVKDVYIFIKTKILKDEKS
jgi:hypothetical protein